MSKTGKKKTKIPKTVIAGLSYSDYVSEYKAFFSQPQKQMVLSIEESELLSPADIKGMAVRCIPDLNLVSKDISRYATKHLRKLFMSSLYGVRIKASCKAALENTCKTYYQKSLIHALSPVGTDGVSSISATIMQMILDLHKVAGNSGPSKGVTYLKEILNVSETRDKPVTYVYFKENENIPTTYSAMYKYLHSDFIECTCKDLIVENSYYVHRIDKLDMSMPWLRGFLDVYGKDMLQWDEDSMTMDCMHYASVKFKPSRCMFYNVTLELIASMIESHPYNSKGCICAFSSIYEGTIYIFPLESGKLQNIMSSSETDKAILDNKYLQSYVRSSLNLMYIKGTENILSASVGVHKITDLCVESSYSPYKGSKDTWKLSCQPQKCELEGFTEARIKKCMELCNLSCESIKSKRRYTLSYESILYRVLYRVRMLDKDRDSAINFIKDNTMYICRDNGYIVFAKDTNNTTPMADIVNMYNDAYSNDALFEDIQSTSERFCYSFICRIYPNTQGKNDTKCKTYVLYKSDTHRMVLCCYARVAKTMSTSYKCMYESAIYTLDDIACMKHIYDLIKVCVSRHTNSIGTSIYNFMFNESTHMYTTDELTSIMGVMSSISCRPDVDSRKYKCKFRSSDSSTDLFNVVYNICSMYNRSIVLPYIKPYRYMVSGLDKARKTKEDLYGGFIEKGRDIYSICKDKSVIRKDDSGNTYVDLSMLDTPYKFMSWMIKSEEEEEIPYELYKEGKDETELCIKSRVLFGVCIGYKKDAYTWNKNVNKRLSHTTDFSIVNRKDPNHGAYSSNGILYLENQLFHDLYSTFQEKDINISTKYIHMLASYIVMYGTVIPISKSFFLNKPHTGLIESMTFRDPTSTLHSRAGKGSLDNLRGVYADKIYNKPTAMGTGGVVLLTDTKLERKGMAELVKKKYPEQVRIRIESSIKEIRSTLDRAKTSDPTYLIKLSDEERNIIRSIYSGKSQTISKYKDPESLAGSDSDNDT